LPKSFENQTTKKPNPKISKIRVKVGRSVATIRKVVNSKAKSTNIWLTLITGFLFGFSVSVGLGLNNAVSVVLGAVVATGVLVTGSLVAYLLLQTFSLAVIAGMSRLAFSFNGSISLEPLVFQTLYLSVVCITPLLIFIPKVKNALSSLSISNSVQLFASGLFLALSLFLRSRLPSDPEFGLSKMYFGEDNGGIISHLSFLLNVGYSSPVSHYGMLAHLVLVRLSFQELLHNSYLVMQMH
jgi:hypothetical protein